MGLVLSINEEINVQIGEDTVLEFYKHKGVRKVRVTCPKALPIKRIKDYQAETLKEEIKSQPTNS